jgi:hypothetical protein
MSNISGVQPTPPPPPNNTVILYHEKFGAKMFPNRAAAAAAGPGWYDAPPKTGEHAHPHEGDLHRTVAAEAAAADGTMYQTPFDEPDDPKPPKTPKAAK